MSLPPRTKMWLTVLCATGIEKLKDNSITNKTGDRRQEAEEELKEAIELERECICNANKEMQPPSNGPMSTEVREKLEKAQEKRKEIEDELSALPKKGDAPNPFVIIAIDNEEDKDTRPMLYTKAVRSTTNPIWKEKFEDFPIEMYLTGKTCREIFHNGDENYKPQKLVFFIYHDDGVKEKGKEKPKKSDDSWKRDNPQRDLLIGKVEWDWFDLCRKVGCAEFEMEFPIIHPLTRKKIKDALFTIKVRLCAPRIRHCPHSCHPVLVEDEAQELVEVGRVQPVRQKKKTKSRSSVHGDDCLCSRCIKSSTRRAPSRRLVLRKI